MNGDELQRFLDAIKLQNSPELQQWVDEGRKRMRMFESDPTGASMDQMTSAAQRVSRPAEELPYGAGQVAKGLIQTGRMPTMDWAANIAGDVGGRVNAASGVGDYMSSLALQQMAQGDAMDPFANFARYLIGKQQDPRPRL